MVMLLMGLSLIAWNYVRFIRRGDANEMLRKLEKQSSRQAARDELRLFGLIALSFLLPIAIGALRHLLR